MVDLERRLSPFKNAIGGTGSPGAWIIGTLPTVVRKEPAADLWSDFGFPDVANAVREIAMLCGWSEAGVITGRTLAVVSARENEGKTSLAWALAIATAFDTEADVALVECDLAHPCAAADLGLGLRPGLSEILESTDEPTLALQERLIETKLRNLRLLPAGGGSRNPSGLLRSPRMLATLAELQRQFAFVVLDLPAVLHSSEAAALCRLSQGTLVVVHAGVTDEREVQRALHLLSGATIHGVVLNRRRLSTPRALRQLVEA